MTLPIIAAENLHKQFGSAHAVNGISLVLHKGRCTSLLGPNGAGKTTTLKLLAGLIRPTRGVIRFSGFDDSADIRRHIGYLPQYPAFYRWMSAAEFMEHTALLFGLKPKEAKERSRELLQLVGLQDSAKRRIGGFSGGMRQRLGLAQALVNRPLLLILDEPVSALDPFGRREVMELIQRMKQETTILFSTHVLHDAEEISDDVLIMRQGQIVAAGSLEELRRNHRQPIIRVEWDASPADWASRLAGQLGTLIKAHTFQGSVMQAEVEDMEEAMPKLLEALAKSKAPVKRVEAGSSTLEDLFMKVVGG